MATHRAASSPSRTSRLPHEEAEPGTWGTASRSRRRTRRRRARHPSQLGAGHRADRGRGWRHPESRHQRPSCRRGRHRQPRQGTTVPTAKPRPAAKPLGAHREAQGRHREAQRPHREGRRWVMRPSRTTGTGYPRTAAIAATTTSRPTTKDTGSPTGRALVPVRCSVMPPVKAARVAGTYADFDMPAICAGSVASRACVC